MSLTTPSLKLSTSISDFSVSTTAMMSPRRTSSPDLTRHSRTVPASMSAPREGMVNVDTSAHRPVGCRDNVGQARQGGLLHVVGVGHRHLGGTHSLDGRVELIEGLLGHPGGDFG